MILNNLLVSVSPLVNVNGFVSNLAQAKDELRKALEVKADYCSECRAEYFKSIDGGIDDNGIAHINVIGEIVEVDECIAYWWGLVVPSTVGRVLKSYEANANCKEIHFHFNTGGGAIGTIPELADAIFYCEKPTKAIVTENCCSAGYWLASQCDSIIATRGATIGALGVYIVLTDYSKHDAERGIITHLISTAELKGIGEWGTPLTEAQREFLQGYINDSGKMFLADIKRSRPSFDVELFTGAFWHSEMALDLGVIDDMLV